MKKSCADSTSKLFIVKYYHWSLSIKSNVSGFAINPIGDDGFAKMFPKEINNVQDLVNQYDEVLNVISKWPDVDNKKYFKDDKGNEYNYYTLPFVQ